MILGRLLKSSTEIFQSPMLFLNKSVFSNFSCFFLHPRKCSNLNYNCSNLLDMRDLQEQVKKAFCYQKILWPFTVWINCSSDLKNFANSRPSASNFKTFYTSLEQFFLTVGQNNFGNKWSICWIGEILKNKKIKNKMQSFLISTKPF